MMKKLLGILVLGLLFISIDLSNPTTVKAKTFEQMVREAKRKNMGFFERQLDKYDSYKRRKAYCAEVAKSAKSDFAAKKIYKACMDD